MFDLMLEEFALYARYFVFLSFWRKKCCIFFWHASTFFPAQGPHSPFSRQPRPAAVVGFFAGLNFYSLFAK